MFLDSEWIEWFIGFQIMFINFVFKDTFVASKLYLKVMFRNAIDNNWTQTVLGGAIFFCSQ